VHGEAVAYGLRAACRIGVARGATPPERAERVERLLTVLDLATAPLPYPIAAVRDALGVDKKHRGGQLRWILPTAESVTTDAEVPDDLVEQVAAAVLAGEEVAA
jgi:3-dehydroquinate synthase